MSDETEDDSDYQTMDKFLTLFQSLPSAQAMEGADIYLKANPDALRRMPPDLRGEIFQTCLSLTHRDDSDSKQLFAFIRQMVAHGCRWTDGTGEWEENSALKEILEQFHSLISMPEISAREWVEVLCEGKADLGRTVAPDFWRASLWAVLTAKAATEGDEVTLNRILEEARKQGIQVDPETKNPDPGELISNLEIIRANFLKTDRAVFSRGLRLFLRAGVDIELSLHSVYQELVKEPSARFSAEAAERFKRGDSPEPQTDFQTVVSAGKLSQLVKEMCGGERVGELMEACKKLSPYYREKYRYTLVSLPRIASVEESALAGWVRT